MNHRFPPQTHRRTGWLSTLTATLAFAAHASAADLPSQVRVLLDKRCLDCHDSDSKKGNLDLTKLEPDFTTPETFARWVKIHDRVRDGEMPPPKKEQPTPKDREAMLKSLSEVLNQTDSRRQREQGRVSLRRLNRTDYENTIRDLFALPGLKVKDLLPEDGRYDGFDKATTALSISAVQLRKYVEAADFVLDTAVAHQAKPIVWQQRYRRIGGLSQFGEAAFPISHDGKVDMDFLRKIRGPDGKGMHLLERQEVLKTIDSLAIMSHTRPSWTPEIGDFSPFHSGYYRLKVSVWSFDYDKGVTSPASRGQSFALTADGRVLAYLDAPSLKPKEHELVVWLNAAERLELNPANLWGNFNTPYNYVGPCVAVDYVDVEGPLHDSWPPASHRRLFGNLPIAELPVRKDIKPETYPAQPPPLRRHPGARPHHVDGDEFKKWQPVWTAASPRPAEDAERLLKDFLPRAFRRPVAEDEIAVYVGIARERLKAGDFFETAMRTAYRTALCSPDFLFLQEPPGDAKDPNALDQYAVASRLSYFLWNSMPDDELIALADKKTLGGALGKQVDRMLADPKSERFINDFLDQWLGLREIDFTSPDAKLYPEFRPDLRDAMLEETRAFFRELITNDLGVANFVDSDFLMINERLAEHYGVPGVRGSAIRRVPKPAGLPRGGFLTQGAILKVTANGTTTSPVKRGAWVMDRILGRPPQPPPPDIPAVDPDVRGLTTIREQLDKHRHEAVCASCHSKMDPPGFALESFDVIGGWRTKYRFVGEKVEDPSQRLGEDPTRDRFLGVGVQQWEYVLTNVRLGRDVDASGAMVDGRSFHDIQDFRRFLLADEEALARNFVNRLVLYSTGAPVGFSDRTQVDQILNKSRDTHYGLKTLIRELALNPTFFRRK